uniref:Capsid protein n=1 Tax=Dromedary picobirnavirus TaxID=1574421 RepID=A0A0A1EKX7_9VIRU|nr:capsid protein [Dromedary picobirnavirus]
MEVNNMAKEKEVKGKETKPDIPVETGTPKDEAPKPKGDFKDKGRNSGSKKKGKRGNPRDGGKRDDDKPKPCNINDVRWYTKYPSIVAGSSSHIFNAILGHKYQPINFGSNTNTTQVTGAKQAIPGVVSLMWAPFYSMKGTEVDAVNVASKNLYTYVRHANSGSVNYESSDLMQYVLAVQELFAYAEQCKRDLKMIFTFKTTNRYLYQRVLWATGYTMSDIADMIDNYALYSNKLNILIAQLNTFKIPKEMSVLARHTWLASHVWKDDQLDKATTYVYAMQGFYHYDWSNGELEFNRLLPTLSSTMSFPVRLGALQTEINNLLAYEDIGIMLGDILKAYGNDSCYFATPLLQGEVYDAEYSAEVTHQIRNAVVLGSSYAVKIKQVASNSQLLYETQQDDAPAVRPVGDTTSTATTMTFANGRYYFNIHGKGNSTSDFLYKFRGMAYNPFLIIDADTPTNEEIILNTRFMYSLHATQSHVTTTQGPHYDAVIGYTGEVGTEVLVSSLIVTLEDSLSSGSYSEAFNGGALTTLMIDPSPDATNHIVSQQYKVDDIPQRCIIYTASGGALAYISTYYYGKNVITAEDDWLELLHKGCKMSEFTIPMFKLLEARK